MDAGTGRGLERFKTAQDSPHAGYAAALDEIGAGGKRGHWIWYVFPQLTGLGRSSTARAFGIDGPAEAAAYLRDAELRTRLLTMTTAVLEQLKRGIPLRTLMGSDIDALKLVSSLTLFGAVGRTLAASEPGDAYAAIVRAATEVLVTAAEQGYPPCAYTLNVLTPSRT